MRIKIYIIFFLGLFLYSCNSSKNSIQNQEIMFSSSKKKKNGLYDKSKSDIKDIKGDKGLGLFKGKDVNSEKVLKDKQKQSYKERKKINKQIRKKNKFDRKISNEKNKGGE